MVILLILILLELVAARGGATSRVSKDICSSICSLTSYSTTTSDGPLARTSDTTSSNAVNDTTIDIACDTSSDIATTSTTSYKLHLELHWWYHY